MALRHNFPPCDSSILGGASDGLIYKTAFAGSSMEDTLNMVRIFLKEEGYGDIPLPASGEEMLLFLHPERGRHPHLFEDPDYAHYPVRLVLPKRDRLRKKIIVELYNEAAPDSLLRFHRRQCPEREARIRRAIEISHVEEYGAYMNIAEI